MNNYRGQRRSNGGGQRYSRNNGGGQRRQSEHEPNRASLRPNMDKQRDGDRDLMGVVTIEEPGVYFISGWENEYDDGNRVISLRLAHADPDIRERQRREADQRLGDNGGSRNGGQRGNGGGQRNGGGNRGGQRPQQRRQEYRDNGYEDNRAYQEGGAMTRARPIPEVRYNDNGPYDDSPMPNGPDDYNVSYDDKGPPY